MSIQIENCPGVLSLFDERFFKFLLAGVANTIAGTSVMFVLYNAMHLSYWISSAANYAAGGLCSFFLSKLFVFKNSRKSISQVFLFIINLAVCYFIAYGIAQKFIFKILSEHTERFCGNVSLITGMILYTILNYVGQRFFVFRNQLPEKTEERHKENIEK